jgi:hypothetical protein
MRCETKRVVQRFCGSLFSIASFWLVKLADELGGTQCCWPSILEKLCSEMTKNISRLTSHQALRQSNDAIDRNHGKQSAYDYAIAAAILLLWRSCYSSGRSVISRIGSTLVIGGLGHHFTECMIRPAQLTLTTTIVPQTDRHDREERDKLHRTRARCRGLTIQIRKGESWQRAA